MARSDAVVRGYLAEAPTEGAADPDFGPLSVTEAADPPLRSENDTRGLILVAAAGMFWSLGGLFSA